MQVEARINQDQNISKDLTLWNQQGSQVLRGQMLVLPIEHTFLYVEPIYLQASQAKMPQLKKIALAMGNTLVYADTYQQALEQLAGQNFPTPEAAPPRPPTANGTPTPAPPSGYPHCRNPPAPTALSGTSVARQAVGSRQGTRGDSDAGGAVGVQEFRNPRIQRSRGRRWRLAGRLIYGTS